MEGGLSLLNVPVDAVSRDVSPNLHCYEVMTSSATSGGTFPMPSPVNSDVLDSPLCDERHFDCASCEVRGEVADWKQQHGHEYMNTNGIGPFKFHNHGNFTTMEQTVPVCPRLNSETLTVHYDVYYAKKFLRIRAKNSMQGSIKRLSYYHAM